MLLERSKVLCIASCFCCAPGSRFQVPKAYESSSGDDGRTKGDEEQEDVVAVVNGLGQSSLLQQPIRNDGKRRVWNG